MSNSSRIVALISIAVLIYLISTANLAMLAISFVYYKIVVGTFGNQIAQHRYFSHQSFQTGNLRKKFLYFVSFTTGVNPVDYALAHRHHHIYSDTSKDVHSWRNSFLDVISPITGVTSYTGAIKYSPVLDSDLKIYHRYSKWFVPCTVLILWCISIDLVAVFFAGIGWNYIHMILFRILLVHYNLPGSYRNFETNDNSWNNKFIQLLDFGEGLHNNHHNNPKLYNQAVADREFDPVGWLVKTFFVENKISR